MTTRYTIEGHLLMADFRPGAEQCRIHPPTGDPILCWFDESLEETVYEYLRRYVRVTGETCKDPATGRVTGIVVKDLATVAGKGARGDPNSAGEFWHEKPLAQLAAEQGIAPVQRMEEVWGKVSDLWADEEDFNSFLAAVQGLPDGST